MANIKLKQLISEFIEEARIYGDPYRTSDEYELTPEELSALKNMDHKQRMNFALKKIKQARRAKGQCISGGSKCEPPPKKEDGTPGPYCKKHLESFRVTREKLATKRGSCTRCPNPPLPGKKLCKDCTDELQILRLTALNKGLCLRCKKVPAEKNERGRQTLFCNDCNKIKQDTERARKKSIKNWKGYGRDVVSSIRARKIANLGIKEYAIKGSVPDEPQGSSPFPSELQKFLDILKEEAKKHGRNINELAALVSTDKGGDRVWTIINLLHRQLGLRFSPKQKKWIVVKGDETALLTPGSELAYAKNWITGF